MTETGDKEILEALTAEHWPILVAVDFSDDSRAAVLWAGALAGRIGGKLIVLHVVHDPAAGPGYYRPDNDTPLQPMERAAERMLDDFLADLQHDHPELIALQTAEKRLISGLPPGRIVESARLLNAKLIVIGSRGMTGLPHLLQGSVSERVVELAHGPVVVIKAQRDRQRGGNGKRKEEKAERKTATSLKNKQKNPSESTQATRPAEPGAEREDG